MTKFSTRISCSIRKKYVKIFPPPIPILPERDSNPDRVSQKIYEILQSDAPCMIARFGATEINCICNYLAIIKPDFFRFISGKRHPWWWERETISTMKHNAGFFSPSEEELSMFSERMLQDSLIVDILAAWRHEERFLKKELAQAYKVELEYLTPFWTPAPWTRALAGKKVLVVHPFTETIEKQYLKRELIHSNPDSLPLFELKTLKSVQSIAGECSENFKNWFSALEYMEEEIDKIDYDICIIGCGAYGFPLAAHVKRSGKKAIHIGGATQLLFGIKGKRWENYSGGYDYTKFMNDFWVRPSIQETPKKAASVEGGCYW